MEVAKLLYATEASELKPSEVKRLMDLCSLGIKEVVLLQTTKVEGWEAALADSGLSCKVVMADGPVVAAILSAVHQEAVPLIAAGLNKQAGRRVRRSVIRHLLRSSPVPVIIMPQDMGASGSGQGGVFGHVILATDWSTASQKALAYLLEFKGIIKELEIVHVIDRKLSVKDMRDLKTKLTQWRKMFLDRGIDAESHIYAGKRAEEIILAAKDYDATCIVMGTTGKSALKDFLSNSCSCRVAGTSLVPTLVVP